MDGRLISTYLFVLVWSLALIGLAWIAGLEGIYGHLTPFYALVLPVFASYAEPLAAVVGVAGLGGLVFRPLRRMPRAVYWCGVVLWIALLAALLREVYQALGAADQIGGREPPTLIWAVFRHLPAMGIGALLCIYAAGVHGHLRDGDALSRRGIQIRLGLLYLLLVAFACALASIRGGLEGIAHPYLRTSYEYIGDIGVASSIRDLFGRYLEIRPFLSMHAKVHPPGPIALLWLMSYIVGRSPLALAVATILIGAASVVPLYLWARCWYSQAQALLTCTLFSTIPSIVLFTATSADAIFMPITLTTLWLFDRSVQKADLRTAVLAGLGYGVMGHIKFPLIGIGAYFALRGLAEARHDWWRVARVAAVMVLGTGAVYAGIYWWSGFDIVATFWAAKAQFDLDQLHLDEITPRLDPWVYTILNPAAWFVFAGIPVSVLAIDRVLRPDPALRMWIYTIAGTLAALNVLYLARGEGERSALYVFPFLALLAANRLAEHARATGSPGSIPTTVGFLAVQCWAMECLLYTYW